MKQTNLKSYLLQFLVLIFILLVFTECRNNAQVKKDISTAFATIFFIIFMILGGLPSIIFSAISYKSPSSAMRVLAIVFVSILSLFSLISIPMYSEFWEVGVKEWIMVLAIIQYGTLVVSIILIALRVNNQKTVSKPYLKEEPKKPTIIDDDEIDYMDEILKG